MTKKNYDQVPPCFYRLSVKALIIDENKRFLMTKESNGKWDILGGGLDHGENPRLGLKREVVEEAGLDIYDIDERPAYFTSFPHQRTGTYLANLFYECKIKNLDFTPSRECTKLKFFSRQEALEVDIWDHIKYFIDQYDPEKH